MKSEISRVVIVVNHFKEEAGKLFEEIQAFFGAQGVECIRIPVQEKIPEPLNDIDLAISIGGDGTLLYCARVLAGLEVPILAVNLGDFGFITEVSAGEWKEALEKYAAGRLGVSRRLMFDAALLRANREITRFSGLNDAVVRAGGIPKIIRLQVHFSGSYVGRYRADGVILSTPTGSTAYSMSAGGPILHPEMEAFVLIPICPFTLSNRPIVVPGTEVVTIEVEAHQRADIIFMVDGQDPVQLEPGDRIRFWRSKKASLLILSDRRNFYEVLRSKLNWAGEPNA